MFQYGAFWHGAGNFAWGSSSSSQRSRWRSQKRIECQSNCIIIHSCPPEPKTLVAKMGEFGDLPWRLQVPKILTFKLIESWTLNHFSQFTWRSVLYAGICPTNSKVDHFSQSMQVLTKPLHRTFAENSIAWNQQTLEYDLMRDYRSVRILYLVYLVPCNCTMYILYLVIVPCIYCTLELYHVYLVPFISCTFYILYLVYLVPRVSCPLCILYLVPCVSWWIIHMFHDKPSHLHIIGQLYLRRSKSRSGRRLVKDWRIETNRWGRSLPRGLLSGLSKSSRRRTWAFNCDTIAGSYSWTHLWVIPQSEEQDWAPFDLCGDPKTIYISDYLLFKMSTASHNSNESMPDESMEVILQQCACVFKIFHFR